VNAVVEVQRDSRLPEEDLKLTSIGGTEKFGEDFMETLHSLSQVAASEDVLDRDTMAYATRMSKLRLGEEGVSKVTPDRIYAVAAHPNADKLVVAAGDKSGNLGLWNVDDQAGETGGVVLYEPHTRTINSLEFHPQDPSKLYTSSYDGTVRMMDMGKNSFDFIYGTEDKSGDTWLQYAKLGGGHSAQVMYISDSAGSVTAVDMRTKKKLWSAACHEKKCNTVSVHPLQPEYILTSSLERCAKIWDVRKMGALTAGGKSKKTGPVVTLQDELSVNSATFSPDGKAIAQVSQKNVVRLYHGAHSMSGIIAPGEACNVKHDNKTGRYVPVFHAAWDPKADHAFVIGSMCRPRQVEIFSATGGKGVKGKCTRVMSLQDPEWLGSVQSRNCFHPKNDVVVCGNASGRMHIFR
jgi:WD40 repeat protein